MKYNIYRYYRQEGKKSKFIKQVNTLEEAQAHCQDPATEKKGEWFDGYMSAEGGAQAERR